MRSLILIILLSGNLFAQEFNWQTNHRLPFQIPKLYIGSEIAFKNSSINSDFTFIDGSDDLPCCAFDDGSGSAFSLGFNAEYWLKPKIALIATINFDLAKSSFVNTINVPSQLGETKIYQYDYEVDRTIVNFVFGSKYKFYSGFNIGADLLFLLNLSENRKYTETIVSPVGEVFANGSPTRLIDQGRTPSFRTLNIFPEIFISKDISIKDNLYASLFVKYGLSLFNEISEESWRTSYQSFGIQFYYGISKAD